MSYILDALKKMEHEKAAKAAPAGMTTMSGDLFRGERPRPVGGGAWKLALAAVAAASLAVAATWFFLAPTGRSPVGPSPAPAPGQAPAPAAPVAASPAKPEEVLPQPSPPAAPPPSGRTSLAVAPPPVSAAAAGRGGALKRMERSSALPTVGQDGRAAAPAQSAPPADLTVSGIAWQEERRARRAVVNGFLLKEGSVVAGARIGEIHRDRVRFSRAGGQFDISLASPGDSPSGVTKSTTP